MSNEFTGTYVTVGEERLSKSGKTKIWTVRSRWLPESVLGMVKWQPEWRCYALYPEAASYFEEVCMRELANFCQAQTMRHVKIRLKEVTQ